MASILLFASYTYAWGGTDNIPLTFLPTVRDLKATLDVKMKWLQSAGIGVVEGSIGWCYPTDNCYTPWCTYMNSLYFAVRSGIKHRHLRSSPCQIAVRKRKTISLLHGGHIKNHPVGLHGRKKNKQKVVIHHTNQDHPGHCFMSLFKRCFALNASKSPSRCFLPLAFTPFNINMLAPLNHWKTIH